MNVINFFSDKKPHTEYLVYSCRALANAIKSYYPELRTPNVHIQVNDRFWIWPKYYGGKDNSHSYSALSSQLENVDFKFPLMPCLSSPENCLTFGFTFI